MSDTWWREHVRPRDLFIWGAVAMLLTLAGVVWTTRRDADATATVLSLLIGACTTLGGYYQGHKDADRAVERESRARLSAAKTLDELRKARSELDTVRAGLDQVRAEDE